MDTTNAIELRLKCLELAVQSSGHADEGIVLIKARKFLDFLTTGAGPRMVDSPTKAETKARVQDTVNDNLARVADKYRASILAEASANVNLPPPSDLYPPKP
jgi:hypothetical protein